MEIPFSKRVVEEVEPVEIVEVFVAGGVRGGVLERVVGRWVEGEARERKPPGLEVTGALFNGNGALEPGGGKMGFFHGLPMALDERQSRTIAERRTRFIHGCNLSAWFRSAINAL